MALGFRSDRRGEYHGLVFNGLCRLLADFKGASMSKVLWSRDSNESKAFSSL